MAESTTEDAKGEIVPEKELSLQFFSATEASLKHPKRNEDAVSFGDGWVLVMDGLGGRPDGDKASSMAMENLARSLIGSEPMGYIAVEEKVHNAVMETHKKLVDELPDSATTMVLGRTYIKDGKRSLFIANVGDSRAYLYRDGVLQKITEDDTKNSRETAKVIDEATSKDDLKTDEHKYAFVFRNGITNSIGGGEILGVNPYARDLRSKDLFIFTTDGVNDNLATQEILDVIEEGGSNIAESLVKRAKSRSGEGSFRSHRDDISAVVMRVA